MNNHVKKTADFIKKKFEHENSGHDWWHMYRVWQLAKRIAKSEEGADMEIVELAALLHDIDDHKFNGGDMEAGPARARQWLEGLGASEKTARQVENIIRNISFDSGKLAAKNTLDTIEGQIVHDADKLDAMGAVGIARLFTMAGAIEEQIYDPEIPVEQKIRAGHGVKSVSAIHHYNEKLIHLKGRMFTKTGKKMAEHRHKFLEDYLSEFYAEWDGNL